MTNSFYELDSNIVHPELPDYWGFYSFVEYDECPRKWMLRRAQFSNSTQSIYPDVYSESKVKGIITHKIIKDFCDSYIAQEDSLNDYFRKFDVNKNLDSAISVELEKLSLNPRVDVTRKMDIDREQIILSIKNAIKQIPLKAKRTKATLKPYRKSGQKKRGHEVGFKIDEPNLTCVVDYFFDGTLIDYKTGKPKEQDKEQVKFYASIINKCEGSYPAKTILHYTSFNKVEEVLIEEDDYLNRISETISTRTSHFEMKDWPANVREVCRYCPVRQLCDDYWDIDDKKEMIRNSSKSRDVEFRICDKGNSLRNGLVFFPVEVASTSQPYYFYTDTRSDLAPGDEIRALNVIERENTLLENRYTELFIKVGC